ncbi:MAG: hypothetical protein H6R00_3473 [Proteobacteria bacterium]|nr:hypothetical protein [Pseudomonadota bacterium]
MTTIDSSIYTMSANRYAVMKGPDSLPDFADQVKQEATSTTKPESDKLPSMLAELEELDKHQLSMSISEYLSASFAIKDRISTERLSAGEDLDVIGVRFEGRTYKLAGKVFGPGFLKLVKTPYNDRIQFVNPESTTRIDQEHPAKIDTQI